jgi:hypothetical protein
MLVLWKNYVEEVIPDEEVEVHKGAACPCPVMLSSTLQGKRDFNLHSSFVVEQNLGGNIPAF